jgi:glucose-6-phosphate isomerase
MSLKTSDIRHTLEQHAETIKRPDHHLKELLKDPQRITTFSLDANRLWFDFSRQRLTSETLTLLYHLAQEQKLKERFAR